MHGFVDAVELATTTTPGPQATGQRGGDIGLNRSSGPDPQLAALQERVGVCSLSARRSSIRSLETPGPRLGVPVRHELVRRAVYDSLRGRCAPNSTIR